MPDISVIIPVYQAEKYIQKCIECVQKQTFQDWELLLIDDASRDASAGICDRCAAEDERIRVFHRPKNGGVSAARNLGLREAKGDWIAFLDADDRFEFKALETLWNLREQHDADTAACAHLNLFPDGSKRPEPVLPSGVYDQNAIRENIVAPLLGDRLQVPVFNGFIWRYLFSARLIRKLRLTFEGAYLEDELFLLEYFCNAQKLAVTEQPLYRYFQNPNSATHRYMADFMDVFTRFMERKEALAAKYQLDALRPQWRASSNWAGLLIAIGNIYAKDNTQSVWKKQKAVKELCGRPEMAAAIRELAPAGMTPHKQMVAQLVRGKHFFVLTQLYRLKNRI